MLSRTLLFTAVSALLSSWSVVAQDADSILRFVVGFNNTVLPDDIDSLLALAGIDVEIPLSIPELFMRVLLMRPSVAKLVANLAIVDFIEQDVMVKLIPPVSQSAIDIASVAERQGGGELTPYGIEMVQALDVGDSNVSDRMVCIIDSGYYFHVDLPGSAVVTGSDTVGVQPWDEDGYGHGTHVAGTIAAIGGNDQGVVGVNRNGQLRLHIVRVFDSTGESYSSDFVSYIQECVNAGANVVSMSFKRVGNAYVDGPTEFERRAFEQFYNEGTLLVAAAGNDGTTDDSWPASYDSVMSVAAVNENKELADFSQRNYQVEIAAPGVDIVSTFPNNEYAVLSGTSMATPHVSGVAALVWSHFPDKTAKEIRQALDATAEDLLLEGADTGTGFGLVQAAAALQYLESGGSDTPTLPSDPTPEAPGECVDDPTWVDAWGDGCEWYEFRYLCQAFGPLSLNDGKTAIEACCTCGGGTSLTGNDGASAAAPVLWTMLLFPWYIMILIVSALI